VTVDREIGRLIREGAEFEIVERMLLDYFYVRLNAAFTYDEMAGQWVLNVDHGDQVERATFYSFHEMLSNLLKRLDSKRSE
jgi:hypothetical protein